VRWARQTLRARVPARKREGTTRRPARRKTRRSERCSASRRDGVARQREQAATRRSRGLGRWGAHSRGSGVEPLPTRNLHGAKSGTQMSEARRALDAQHGGASRGHPRLETSAPRFGPHMMGCTAASSWVEARGTYRKMRHEGLTWAITAASSRLGARRDDRPAQHWGALSSAQATGLAKEDNATHRGATVESSPTRCRGYVTARKRFAALRSQLCFYSPSTASRRGSLQQLPARRRQRTAQPRLLPLPTRAPPLLPPPLLAAADREGEKPQCVLACERGSAPGCRRTVKAAHGQRHDACSGWLVRRKL
jgi:hypothetical protein